MIDVGDLNEQIHDLATCCLKHPLPPDAVSVVASNECSDGVWGKTSDSYADTESFAIYLDAKNDFWAWWECSDTSGHGCVCSSGYAGPFNSLEDAIRLGLSDDQRIGYAAVPK